MIAASEIELRAGSELLLTAPMLRVDKGDRIGLVGRNGAGKTTLTRVLASEAAPASGSVKITGSVGYLPQDPRTADPDQLARLRILSARGLDAVSIRMIKAAEALAMPGISADDFDRAGDRYNRALGEFEGLADIRLSPKQQPLQQVSGWTNGYWLNLWELFPAANVGALS